MLPREGVLSAGAVQGVVLSGGGCCPGGLGAVQGGGCCPGEFCCP